LILLISATASMEKVMAEWIALQPQIARLRALIDAEPIR
jgi:hypothetical protein